MGRKSTRALHPPRDGVAALARLRRICLALPGTSEKVSHGEPTFWVGGRMFAQLDNHHHGADHVVATVRHGGDAELLALDELLRDQREPPGASQPSRHRAGLLFSSDDPRVGDGPLKHEARAQLSPHIGQLVDTSDLARTG